MCEFDSDSEGDEIDIEERLDFVCFLFVTLIQFVWSAQI